MLSADSVEDAASQLDFLYEISATTNRPAELMFLKAKVGVKQGASETDVVKNLNDAIQIRSTELEVCSKFTYQKER